MGGLSNIKVIRCANLRFRSNCHLLSFRSTCFTKFHFYGRSRIEWKNGQKERSMSLLFPIYERKKRRGNVVRFIANIIISSNTHIRYLRMIFLSGTRPWKPWGMRTPWHRLRERQIFTANPVETRICTYSTISRSSATILRYVHVRSSFSSSNDGKKTRSGGEGKKKKKGKNWRVNDEQDIG